MDLTIEADTLDEANQQLTEQIPEGEFILFKKIESDGRPVTISATDTTTHDAYAKAEALVPKGATVIERRDIRQRRTRFVERAAVDEADARKLAGQQGAAGSSVRSVTLTQPGRSGVLGFGRRLPQWRIEIEEPAVVEVLHRSPARICVRTGSRPDSWDALIAAMRALTDKASAQPLQDAWPYQTSFLLLTGTLDDPGFFRDLPLVPITSGMIGQARQYVEKRSLPGMLGFSGDLDPDRFRNMGGGRIGRMTNPMTDSSIVGVASCLPRERISMSDDEAIGRRAFDAIKHYAAIPVVRFCFCLPYIERALQTKQLDPTAAQIDVYKATEALLLEIWDELGEGQVITDELVTRKARAILTVG